MHEISGAQQKRRADLVQLQRRRGRVATVADEQDDALERNTS